MKIKRIFICLFIICSCDFKDEVKLFDFYSSNGVELEDKSNESDWDCFSLNKKRFCIPKNWNKVDQSNFELFYYLEDTDKNNFLVFIDYNLLEMGLSPKQYCLEVYRQLTTDPNEDFKKYNFTELVMDSKSVFYGEFITEINEVEYLTYSLYMPYNESFYDITLKFRLDRKNDLYGIFQNILYNMKIDGAPLFDFDKEVQEVKAIDFTTWQEGIAKG